MPKNMPIRLLGFVPSHSGEIALLMPISSSPESKLCTPWESPTNSEQQERNKWQGQNGLLWLKSAVKLIGVKLGQKSQVGLGPV